MKLSLRLSFAVFFLVAIYYLYIDLDELQTSPSSSTTHGRKNISSEKDSPSWISSKDRYATETSTTTYVVVDEDDTSLDEDVEEEENSIAFNASSKVIVIGKLSTEDTSWVEKFLPDWQRAIYTVNDTTAPLYTRFNKGREANPYLTYLIENYDNLPSTIAFLHHHRGGYPQGWHNDAPNYDNVLVLRSLQLPYVQETGYVNLRCNPEPGCPVEVHPFRRQSPDSNREFETRFVPAWEKIFGPEYPVPASIGVACCGQFAVSKWQILAHPKEVYERALNWLLQSEDSDYITGRVMEYTWHVLFGKEAIHCPDIQDCYCNVFGRCLGEAD